jgi:hypothetical protein
MNLEPRRNRFELFEIYFRCRDIVQLVTAYALLIIHQDGPQRPFVTARPKTTLNPCTTRGSERLEPVERFERFLILGAHGSRWLP